MTAIQKTDNSNALTIETMSEKWRIAQRFSLSTIIPQLYQGKPENVLVAMEIAENLKTNPFTVMQSLHIISGKPSLSSKFLQYLLIKSNLVKGRLAFDYVGEVPNMVCTVSAVDRESERLLSASYSYATAVAEGLTTKNGTKWKSIPEQMLSYRAISTFVNRYYPEISLGLGVIEEVEMFSEEPSKDEIIDFSVSPQNDEVDFSDVLETPIVDEHEFPVQPTIFKEIN
jgi:hypothetical protein